MKNAQSKRLQQSGTTFPLGHMDDYPGVPYTRAMFEAEKRKRWGEASRARGARGVKRQIIGS